MRTLRYLFTFLLSYWSYIGVNSLSIPQNEFQHLLEHKEFPHFALFFCAKVRSEKQRNLLSSCICQFVRILQ